MKRKENKKKETNGEENVYGRRSGITKRVQQMISRAICIFYFAIAAVAPVIADACLWVLVCVRVCV